MDLNERELIRYKKQLQLPEIGVNGQLKLKQSSVLVVGAGGLGSPALLYLAAAGVGHIRIVEGDRLDLSNLQRQVMYDTAELGKLKADSAFCRMHSLNPELEIEIHPERLTTTNSEELASGQQCIVDCTDNLETRFTINQVSVKLGIPFVYGAVFRYEGQVSVFDPTHGPCFRCLYPVIPTINSIPDPDANGLLGTVPGLIGVLQANEVLKLILGIGEPLMGKLLLYDALACSFKNVRIIKNPECPVCGVVKKF